MTDDNKKATQRNGATSKIRFFSIVTVIWICIAFTLGYFAHEPFGEMSCKGTFSCLTANEWGDFLAGVFAPIAFVGLVVAVWIQSDELREQRMELALTRTEFELNRAVMEEQTLEAKRQAEYLETQTKLLTEEARERKRTAHLTSFLALIKRYVEHSSETSATLAKGGIFQIPIFGYVDEQMSDEKYISHQFENINKSAKSVDTPIIIDGEESFDQAFRFIYSAEELIKEIPFHSRVSWQHSKLEKLLDCYCDLIMKTDQLSHLRNHVEARMQRLQRLSS